MHNTLTMVTVVVHDYDEAIDYYTRLMGFTLLEDTPMEQGKRWVRVQPSDMDSCQLLLARAKNDNEKNAVGNQTGGRVGFFMHTDDFDALYQNWKKNGIQEIRPPSMETYGKVAVFADLYGNLWDVIQPR